MIDQLFLDSKEKTHSAKEIYDLGFKAGIECSVQYLDKIFKEYVEDMKENIFELILIAYKEGKIR